MYFQPKTMRNYSDEFAEDGDLFPLIISTRTIDLQPRFFSQVYKMASSSLEVADNFPAPFLWSHFNQPRRFRAGQ
jgi:hypothetical protein